jgi:hypothetical protein
MLYDRAYLLWCTARFVLRIANNEINGTVPDALSDVVDSSSLKHTCVEAPDVVHRPGCASSDRAVLRRLYLDTQGPQWTMPLWMPGVHHCAWTGVGCTNDTVVYVLAGCGRSLSRALTLC